MKGWVEFLRVDHEPKTFAMQRPLTLERASMLVGGPIEVVPRWDHVEHDGQRYAAVALCHEEGKLEGLPLNVTATQRWANVLGMRVSDLARIDVLSGNVVVVFGDDEFMREWI